MTSASGYDLEPLPYDLKKQLALKLTSAERKRNVAAALPHP